jgi:hypothetical protein
MPEEFVVAVGEDRVPPAPSSEKLTTTPATPLPLASFTLTFNDCGNEDVTGAFCAFPEEPPEWW